MCLPQTDSPGRLNEDAVVVKENETALVTAVIDGASNLGSVTKVVSADTSGGRFAAQTAAEAIQESFGNRYRTASLYLKVANDQIRGELLNGGIDANAQSALELSCASATVASINKTTGRVTIAQIGDSAGLVVKSGRSELAVPIVTEVYDNLAMKTALKIARDKGIVLKDAFRDEGVARLMTASRKANNRPDGSSSGVLNGNQSAERYIVEAEFNLSSLEMIILLTDGLWPPTETFNAEPDWNHMLRIIKEGGLQKLYETCLETRRSDPDLNRFPRFKQYDDAGGVNLTWTKFTNGGT